MDTIIFRVVVARRRMYLSRFLIKTLGNPTHLSFWYDEGIGCLFVTAADKNDLAAYEIQSNFWKSTKHSCEISRFSFLLALQHRAGWVQDGSYLYEGVMGETRGLPAGVFKLADGTHAGEGDDQCKE